MTTQKQWDAFHAEQHTPEEKEAFNNYAMAHYEPDINSKMFIGLGVYVGMALLVLALGWVFIAYGVPYVLHIPEVSTPDRVWTVTP